MKVGYNQVDISELIEINKTKKKLPWPERKALIERYFPSCKQGAINWVRLFDDPHTLGFVWQDILKVESAEPGRDGPRPTVSENDGLPRLRELWDEDYSYLPFGEALQAIARARRLSIRGVAAKTGINYQQINRLLRNEAAPTIEDILAVSTAFRKAPSYFYDYRIAALEAAMEKEMADSPEISVFAYKRLIGTK